MEKKRETRKSKKKISESFRVRKFVLMERERLKRDCGYFLNNGAIHYVLYMVKKVN